MLVQFELHRAARYCPFVAQLLFSPARRNLAGMTTFDHIDRAMAARGVRYDVGDEEFYDGNRPAVADELLGIIPEVTLDQLASCVDHKYGQLGQRRLD